MVVAETAYWLVGSEGAVYQPYLHGFKRWRLKEARVPDGNVASVDSS
jgi:hypothetical protein